jgi:hypothetical protein
MPAITDQVLASSCGLGELRREPFDPPVDRDVVDLDPALGQQLHDVPIGEAEPQVLAECQGDELRVETGTRRRPSAAPGGQEGIGEIS